MNYICFNKMERLRFLLLQLLIFISISSQVKCYRNKCSRESSEESNYKCEETCYRPIDGYCNNLQNPNWGTPYSEYKRLFDVTSYKDGINELPDLRNVRELSLAFGVDINGLEDKWTVNTIWWGQVVAHDVSLTDGVPQTAPGVPCPCVNGRLNYSSSESDRCDPILFPIDDPYNAPEGRECIDFLRTNSTYFRNRQSKKPTQQFTSVTSYLDGSIVYGNDVDVSNTLRKFENGMLNYQIRNGKMYPPQVEDEETLCPNIGEKDTLCLFTGDDRVNQNPHIAFGQTIYLRYHNYVAKELCTKINPHWDDETCFQEARRILIAVIQHITYYEFLVVILGPKCMYKNNLIYKDVDGYVNDYDETVDPSALNEHSTAAYRIFHSSIVGFFKSYSQKRKQIGEFRLSDHLTNPSILLKEELGIATGAATQMQLKVDRFYDTEVTQHLFRQIDEKLGEDLLSIDIYRSRDHGLPPYYVAVEKCGLGKPTSFDDFKKYIRPKYVELLKRMYKSFKEVDLRVGGNLETPIDGALAGPTFTCIMIEQFRRLKNGDRYWYEYGDQTCPFTKDQLNSIRTMTLSSLICNHVDGFEKIQPRAFEQVSDSNPLGPCEDLPKINLQLWKE